MIGGLSGWHVSPAVLQVIRPGILLKVLAVRCLEQLDTGIFGDVDEPTYDPWPSLTWILH